MNSFGDCLNEVSEAPVASATNKSVNIDEPIYISHD